MLYKFSFVLIFILTADVDGHLYQEIKIINEKINTLSHDFFQKSKNYDAVIKIELINCEIQTIDEDAFDDFSNLLSLDLFNNSISEVNFSIKNLRYLFLSKNLLKNAPNLQKFPKLKNLFVDKNNIEVIDYQLSEHSLENLDVSENPLRVLNVSIKKIADITVKNSKYSKVKLNINCPSLNLLDTSEIEIGKENLDVICKNNNATIYTSFCGIHEMRECSKITKEKNYTTIASRSTTTSKITTTTTIKPAEKKIESETATIPFDESIPVTLKLPSITKNQDNDVVDFIKRNIGVPVNLLVIIIILIIIVISILTAIIIYLVCKTVRSDQNHKNSYCAESSGYLIPSKMG